MVHSPHSFSAYLKVGEVDHPMKNAIRREMDERQLHVRDLSVETSLSFFKKKFEFLFIGTYDINKADM
jgi:hypothetical protein